VASPTSARPIEHFHRYRPIIDYWDEFEAIVQQPLPACIWTNTLKTSPERLASRLPLTPVPWYPGAFRCAKGLQPSHELPFLAGHYLLQEEAALLPVALLNRKRL
jgi:16S rRNA C967 or C1407 C5-methylase (RsmB/RsmF family)